MQNKGKTMAKQKHKKAKQMKQLQNKGKTRAEQKQNNYKTKAKQRLWARLANLQCKLQLLKANINEIKVIEASKQANKRSKIETEVRLTQTEEQMSR